jgi:hypothetical protein
MSAPIGPGDYVECVNAGSKWPGFPCFLILGAIYTVERIVLPGPDTVDDTVFLVGVKNPNDGRITPRGDRVAGFALSRFRPIYRRSDTILKSVLEPVDGLVDA